MFTRTNRIAKAALLSLVTLSATLSPALAKRTAGPGSVQEVANGGTTIFYYEQLRGGEVANIHLSGDGDSDLDLFVFDTSGNLIVADEGDSDQAAVWVKPNQTMVVRIEVRNIGRAANLYTLEMD